MADSRRDDPLRVAMAAVLQPYPWRRRIDGASLAAGLTALAVLVLLSRTRPRNLAAPAALVVPTAGLLLVHNQSVAQVKDSGEIPRGLPLPHLPDLTVLSLPVVTAAVSIAVIVLVQGAGVAESAPNPDGSRADMNGDFAAQGAGNLASGLFRGIPVADRSATPPSTSPLGHARGGRRSSPGPGCC